MRFGIFAGALVAASLVPAAAMAQSKFGGQGQLVISDDQPLGGVVTTVADSAGVAAPLLPGTQTLFGFEFASVSDNHGSGTAFGLNPAADYFVIPNLSVGGQILFDMYNFAVPTGSPQPTVIVFGFAPRIGYNIAITDSISFWPKLDFAYAEFSTSNNGAYGNAFSLGIFAPFIFTPIQHFFVGIGPNLGAELSSTVGGQSAPKTVDFGISATFGGWFLGD